MRPREIRIENLRLLVAEFGTVANVARKAETSEKYLSQILNGVVQRNSPRGIGDRLAERLESGCGKAQGWLDELHGDYQPAQQTALHVAEPTTPYSVQAMQVASMWDQLPTAVQENLYGVIEFSASAPRMKPTAKPLQRKKS